MDKLERSERVLPWAHHMAGMLVRNPIITRDLGLTKNESQAIWQKANNRSSPSGQSPWSPEWYVETAERRFQSALFVLMYAAAREKIKKPITLPHVYYHFARITAGEWKVPVSERSQDPAFREREKDYGLPYTRAMVLVSKIFDGREGDVKEILVKACKSCDSKYLALQTEGGHKCPLCVYSRTHQM